MADKERIQLNLRLDGYRELLTTVKVEAEAAGISVNSFVIRALKSAVGQPTDARQTIASQTATVMPANLEETLFPMLDKMLGDRLASIEERLGKLRA
ncbi:MAG: hypothetical protein ABI262_05820 [Microcoleus sp.]|jgi:hypothetical protein